jgi:hypothetical protein
MIVFKYVLIDEMFVIVVDAMHGAFTEFNGAKLFLLSMIKGAFYNLMHCSPNHFNELVIDGVMSGFRSIKNL